MAANQNSGHYSSFNANMQKVLRNQANQLSLLTALQKAMVADDRYVECNYEDTDGISHTHTLPSYQQVLHELDAVKKALNTLLSGKGTLVLGDDTQASLKLEQIPSTPTTILKMDDPTTFTLDPNWFFESFMYPGAVVTINLSGLVDNRTQQVEVCRIIVNSQDTAAHTLWEETLSKSEFTYAELITILNDQNIVYYQDLQTYTLPWLRNKYIGTFFIKDDPLKINNKIWYYIDTLQYNTISDEGVNQGSNNTLKIGDYLTYNNTVFQILEIDVNNTAIQLRTVSGAAYPGKDGQFHYYTDPTSDKTVQVRFGVDEYDFVFLRAISHEYGIKSNEWSAAYKFDSNKLTYMQEDGSLTTFKFKEVYDNTIVDWGKQLMEEAKNKYIPLTQGTKVNVPDVVVSSFKVEDISLYTTYDSNFDLINQTLENLTTKEQEVINAYNRMLALQKQLSSGKVADDMKNAVEAQLVQLQATYHTLLTQYKSALEEAQNTYTKLAATDVQPHYKVRGFFNPAASSFIGVDNTLEQCIIQYEIAYRYTTSSGNTLASPIYTYRNTDGANVDVTYDQWYYQTTSQKERILNNDTNTYMWSDKDENGQDINCIDLDINVGETIIFKIRAISEAGYPYFCRKSEWSSEVQIDGPQTYQKTGIEDFGDKIASSSMKVNFVTGNSTMSNEDIISFDKDRVDDIISRHELLVEKFSKMELIVEALAATINNLLQLISLNTK